MRWIRSLVTGLCIFGTAANGARADWPQFRGPGGSGVSAATNLPTEWQQDKNTAWKMKVPGYGWSGPIVLGDKVFVTSAVTDKQKKPSAGFGGFGGDFGKGKMEKGGFGKGGFGKGGFGKDSKPPDVVYTWDVLCLNAADGAVLWKRTAAEQKPTISIHGSNTYATETPVTDGERVYAQFGAAGVFCYDLAGNLLWKKDLGAFRMAFGHGTASSPVLDSGRLFLQCDNEEKSFLLALDAKTGEELWRVSRSERTGWSTPLVWKNKQRTEIVCVGSPKARSYDPATGKQLWELGGMSGQPKASAVADEETLYIGTGGGFGGFGGGPGGGGGFGGFSAAKPLFAVGAGAQGDITLKSGVSASEYIAWSSTQAGPSTASPLLYEGHLYILEERGGVLSCYDAKTGKRSYRERIDGARGFTSSPWAYEGKVFCLDDAGTTHVVQAGPMFKLVAQNELGEMFWSSPAVADGALLLRGVDYLYCIKK